jgi:hypothetical protein
VTIAAPALAVALVQPLGSLHGTMLLVLVLPPIAYALDRLGWAEIIATLIAGDKPGNGRVALAYASWSVWLVSASPSAIVAFLLGVNILNLLTPHGSLATILGRNIARSAGVHLPASVYLRNAWRYAVVGTLAGLVPLLFGR